MEIYVEKEKMHGALICSTYHFIIIFQKNTQKQDFFIDLFKKYLFLHNFKVVCISAYTAMEKDSRTIIANSINN